jgi:hypothetical protein
MGRIGIFEILASMFVFILPFMLLMIVSMWKLYTKANKPGWAVLIPIYSTLVLLEIIRKPWWWLLLMLIPLVNIVYAIWATNLFSKAYGKDEGFTVGLILLPIIFYPILAFSKSAEYIYTKTDEFNDIGTATY